MTEPLVIDGEAEEISTTPASRQFRVVTHKTPLAHCFDKFGAEQDLGANVDPASVAQTLWWCSQDWAAQVLLAGVQLPQLLAPTPGFVTGLDREFLNREAGTLRKKDIPNFYAKHPRFLAEVPTVVVSTGTDHSELMSPVVAQAEDLAQGILPAPYDSLPEEVMVQLDQPLGCVVESRYWVAHRELTAACPYRMGMISWESPLFLEMLFNNQGRDLLAIADAAATSLAAEADGPPGYAVDLGVTLDGTVTVLRAWPAWAADPFSADPTGVLRAIAAAHDFENTADLDRWRWTPDLRIYDRSRLAEAETEAEIADMFENSDSEEFESDE